MKSKISWGKKAQFRIIVGFTKERVRRMDGLKTWFDSEKELRKACNEYSKRFGITSFKIKKKYYGVVSIE